MKTGRWSLTWIALCLVLLTMTGCPKQPARINVVLDAATNVNLDVGGQALSVVVRVYQLKDKGRLEAADYNAILKSERDALSDDLLERQERVVQPGTQEMLEIQANPMARYIGAVALFRNPSGDGWRKIIPIGTSRTQKIGLALREQSIEITTSSR